MVTWSSRDRNTATVDSNGVVTALREGTTEIVAEIRDAEGIIAGRHIATVKVVEIEPLASFWPDHSRTVEIYVDNVQDSRLYYRRMMKGIIRKSMRIQSSTLRQKKPGLCHFLERPWMRTMR